MSTLFHPQELIRTAAPVGKRGTYYVQTWGCQMNEEDSEQIALHLRQIGFEPAASLQESQLILLNTCSVRKKPEDKAFSMLGEIALLKKRRPEIVVGVCGCMAQIRAKEIRQRAPHVDFVVGTGQISTIPGLVEETLQTRRFQTRLDLPERKGAVVTDIPKRLVRDRSAAIVEPTTRLKVKAFLPIQYGCDKFCTFCIVPTTRGRERSRPTEDIVVEARALARTGIKEITLLGQTVNSYGKNLAEGRVPFSKLLWLLEGIPELVRIRYTSPYPRDFKSDLIECIRDNPKVMEHVHLPLQSGDDRMLQAMKRQYSVDGFLKIVEELRSAVPQLGLTTDIIVGFPGETDEQFENTLNVMRQVQFDGAYMFIYSARPGTPAGEMPQLPYDLKLQRLSLLQNLQNSISTNRNLTHIGRTVEVLIEGRSPKHPEFLYGYSREFKLVQFDGAASPNSPNSEIGSLAKVKLTEAFQWGLRGEVIA